MTNCRKTGGECNCAGICLIYEGERIKKQFPTKLKDRSRIINVLESYSKFLEDQGYLDTDWRTEHPFAIDEFLKQNDGIT